MPTHLLKWSPIWKWKTTVIQSKDFMKLSWWNRWDIFFTCTFDLLTSLINVTASSELVWTLGGFSCGDWVSCTCNSVRAKLRITNLEHIPTDELIFCPYFQRKIGNGVFTADTWDWQPGSADMPELLLFPNRRKPKYPARTLTDMERTCKLHTERWWSPI